MIYFVQNWLGTLWLIFAIVWLLAAFTSKRSLQRQSYGSRVFQSSLMMIGVVLIFNLLGSFHRDWLDIRLIPKSRPWVLLGAILAVAGMLFCFWARAILGKNWSSTVTIKQNHELILRGPYTLVRHPIYTGLLISLLGSAIIYGYLRCFFGVLICGIALWMKLQIEERFMIQQFGDQYTRYRQKTRALVPFLL